MHNKLSPRNPDSARETGTWFTEKTTAKKKKERKKRDDAHAITFTTVQIAHVQGKRSLARRKWGSIRDMVRN